MLALACLSAGSDGARLEEHGFFVAAAWTRVILSARQRRIRDHVGDHCRQLAARSDQCAHNMSATWMW